MFELRTNTLGIFKSGYVGGCYANGDTDAPVSLAGITGFNTIGYKVTYKDDSYVLLSRTSFTLK